MKIITLITLFFSIFKPANKSSLLNLTCIVTKVIYHKSLVMSVDAKSTHL